MPELPEVETTCQGIRKALVKQSITQLTFRHKMLRWPVPINELKKLKDQTILDVTRRAKYILIHFQSGYFILHLGMSGTLRVLEKEFPFQKHDHFEALLSNGYRLRLNDPRRFGALLWTKSLADLKQLQHLGPEPLVKGFNGAYLLQKAQKYRSPVKSFIMNQQVVVGVGNIYASESLFLAGIHPLQSANSLDLAHYSALAKAIQKVLKSAIKAGGTTLKDFTQADGKPGYFSQRLKVYDRAGESCYQCGTLIENIKLAGRSTYFCSNCQKLRK